MTLLVIKNILYRLLLQSKRRIECCTYNDTSNSSQTTLVSKINTHDSAVQRGGAVNTQATLIAVYSTSCSSSSKECNEGVLILLITLYDNRPHKLRCSEARG